MELGKRAGVCACGTAIILLSAALLLSAVLVAPVQSSVSKAAQSAVQAASQPPSQAAIQPSAAAKAGESGPAKCCAAGGAPKAAAARPADGNVVECHALEMHSNPQPAVSIVVFNQKIKDDHERLSDLLKDNEGASVEIKTADGKWHAASVARLKSCFGRGLLFFSGGASPIQERDDFVLRFPAKKTS